MKIFTKYEYIKRIFDIIFAFIILILLTPLLIFILSLIFIFEEGPAIFKQVRVGKKGTNFFIYKFRTMKYIKNEKYNGLVDDGMNETKINARERFKTTQVNDKRITRIGRFIRPIHFDELPQLINIIKGDMSFVGPRPDVPVQEVDYLEKDWHMRISITPGITGLAQLYQCKKLTERNKLDRIYVKRKSFILDFKIILRTIHKLIYLKSN